jgi:hypothetical protein
VTGPDSHPPVKTLPGPGDRFPPAPSGGIVNPPPGPRISPVPTAATPTTFTSPDTGTGGGTDSSASPGGTIRSLVTGGGPSGEPGGAPGPPSGGRYDWLIILAVAVVLGFFMWKGLKR